MKDVLGTHVKDLLVHLVHLVEYHPTTAKDQSRIHQFGKKVLPGLFLGYALYAGRIWKGDVLVAGPWGVGNGGRIGKPTRKDSMRKGWCFPDRGEFVFQSQMDGSEPLGEIRNWGRPPWYGLDQLKEIVALTFLGNRRGLCHNLATDFRVPVKR